MTFDWWIVALALVSVGGCCYIAGRFHSWRQGWYDGRRSAQGGDDE